MGKFWSSPCAFTVEFLWGPVEVEEEEMEGCLLTGQYLGGRWGSDKDPSKVRRSGS